MKSINAIFEQLSATSSRNEKEAILTKYQNISGLRQAVFLALDPYTQFYQRKIPAYKGKKTTMELNDAMVALNELSTRRVTGNAAIDYLTKLLEAVSEDDAKVIERIIEKDLKCGVQASTANKVWKDLISEYPCMLASGYEDKLIAKLNFPAIAQLKMDGMRFNALVHGDAVDYRSRNGKEVAVNTPELDAAFLQMAKNVGLGNVVFDGELLVVDKKNKPLDRKTGNGILNKAVKGTISEEEKLQVRAIVWDIIPLTAFQSGKCPVDYETRLGTVVTAVDHLDKKLAKMVGVVETTIVADIEEAQKTFKTYFEAGQEGIILKDRNGIWEDKRAKHQIKFKGELECDLKCVGWEEGTGRNKGKLGALVLQSSDAKVNVSVGTGFTDDMRDSIKKKDVLDKIVTIKYNSRISNKQGEDSLFLPVFLEIREDKSKADSSSKIK